MRTIAALTAPMAEVARREGTAARLRQAAARRRVRWFSWVGSSWLALSQRQSRIAPVGDCMPPRCGGVW